MTNDGDRVTVAFMIRTLSIGGAQRHLLKTIQSMDREAFAICVIVLVREDSDSAGLQGDFRRESVPIYYSPFKKNSVAGLKYWVKKLKRMKIDVLQTFLWRADATGCLAGKLAGVPHIFCSERGDRCGERGGGKGLATRLFDRLVTFRFAERIVANSRYGARQLRRLSCSPRKITVVHNGINVREVPCGSDDSALTVGLVGRLEPFKDVSTFLKAAAQVVGRLPNTRFRIVGDGPVRTDLEVLAARLGIQDAVTFCGSMIDPTPEITGFDVCVLSSNGNGNELFPNVLLEYMSYGKPIVATDVGGVREVVDNTVGRVVAPERPDLIAGAVVHLLEDDGLRKQLGDQARNRVQREFDMHDRVREYENLYHQSVS